METAHAFPVALCDRLVRAGAIAVLVIDKVDHALPTARALWEGGVEIAEVTLRTEAAAESLAMISRELPEMLPVAGTVLSPEQVDLAIDSGAAMAVAPGLHRETLVQAQQKGLPFAPGVLTPTEIETAIDLGCRTLKFFPAGTAGGLPLLKSVSAPYQHLHLRFLPTGSISEEAMGDYLAFSATMAVGGSWIAPRTLIQSEDWQEITKRAQRARKIVDAVRQEG
jgi:2-dehydro-3-deoxyphosphogluconate aldolase/(4S)-4-hydroxy-2-oxoglutarate aldolase